MSSNGWIKIHRKLQDCWIWQIDKPFDERSAWIDLLMSANHDDVKIPFNGELVLVERGQLITSIRKLSVKWKWNKDKVLKFLRLLESDGMITRNSDKYRTLVTIENYSIYQARKDEEQTPSGTQGGTDNGTEVGTQDGTQDGQQPATNKNDKKDKKVKNERINNNPPLSPHGETDDKNQKKESTVYYPNDEKLNMAFLDYMDMRKKIKKPMTDRAVALAMNKLQKLSTVAPSTAMDNDLAIMILEESTMNCWQSLYPLKSDNRNNGGQNGTESKWINDWRNA